MLSLSLLGKINCHIDGQPPDRAMTAKVVSLLSYLIVTQQAHSRDALAGLFWGGKSETKAKTSLRVALSTLRKALPDHIDADRLNIRFRHDRLYWCDAAEFERLLEKGDVAAAVALWRGDFMSDIYFDDAPAFEEWLAAQRSRWRQKAIACFSDLADRYVNSRDFEAAVEILRRLIEIEPWHEEGHRQLMQAYGRLRQFNRALAQYESCRLALAAELDVSPMPATMALHERILRAREANTLILPSETTALIGRESDLEILHTQLLNPACRLVTIVGMGGIGKTRLAMALGQRIALENVLLFLDGVTFVPLQGIRDSADVERVALAMAQALNIDLPGRKPPSVEVVAYLQPEERLLILDNFEQLHPTAPWLNHLLRQCPSVKLLVTSRMPLQLTAEWRYPLAGLAYATADDTAAAELLIESVRGMDKQVSLDMACVQKVCQMVEGVPLAIKMVAGWLNTFTCDRVLDQLQGNLDMLATQLQDVPPRQRSMRLILDHTWKTLTIVEQQALSALAIFRGGFSEAGALHLAACTPFVLLQLRERGLVQLDTRHNRFSLHELLHQYAAEKLGPNLEKTAHQHAAFYVKLVAAESDNLRGRRQRDALRRLQPDLDNLRLAWRSLIDQGDIGLLSEMLEGWARYLNAESMDQEAVASLQAALPLLETSQERLTYAHLVRWLAVFTHSQRQLLQAEHYWSLLDKLARQLSDLSLEARALVGLGSLDFSRDNYENAIAKAEKAVALYQQDGDLQRRVRPLNNLGLAYQARGKKEIAKRFYREAIEAGQDSDDEFFIAVPYVNLGFVLTDEGQFEEAFSILQTLLARLKRQGWKRALPQTYYHMGRLLWYRGEYDQAINHYQESRLRFQTADERARVDRALGRLYAIKGEYNRARELALTALAVYQREENASSIGMTQSHLGMIELQAGAYSQARHYFEQAIAILTDINRGPIFEHAQLAWVHMQLGDMEAARGVLDAGKALAERFQSPREGAWLDTMRAAYQLVQGERGPAVEELHNIVKKGYITADNRSFANKIILQYQSKAGQAAEA